MRTLQGKLTPELETKLLNDLQLEVKCLPQKLSSGLAPCWPVLVVGPDVAFA
jgi:hypothetical protein